MARRIDTVAHNDRALTGKSRWSNRNVFPFGLTSSLSHVCHDLARAVPAQSMHAVGTSAAATLCLGKTGIIRFKGSTPLGTSAGEDEAIHYVDSIVAPGETARKHADLLRPVADGTFRFRKEINEAAVRAKNDPELTRLWNQAQRYDGKGCMEAVQHIETILAKAFAGKKVGQLGTLLETDQQLLALEREEALKCGRLDPKAPLDEQIHAMQRKGVIGMNAILSMSLALGRTIAAKEGRELWQLLREMAADAMAKFIVANGGKKDLKALRALSFDDLQTEFRASAAAAIQQGKTIYELLRRQLPVYAAAKVS